MGECKIATLTCYVLTMLCTRNLRFANMRDEEEIFQTNLERCSYRFLQQTAKAMGLPSNVKVRKWLFILAAISLTECKRKVLQVGTCRLIFTFPQNKVNLSVYLWKLRNDIVKQLNPQLQLISFCF